MLYSQSSVFIRFLSLDRHFELLCIRFNERSGNGTDLPLYYLPPVNTVLQLVQIDNRHGAGANHFNLTVYITFIIYHMCK